MLVEIVADCTKWRLTHGSMILSISKMSIVLCISICHLLSHNSLFMVHSHAIFFSLPSPALIIYESSVGHLKLFFFWSRIWLYIPGFPSTYLVTQVVLCLAIFLPHSPEYHYYRHVWMFSLIYNWIRNYNPINFYGFDTSKHYFFKYFCASHVWSRIIIYK